MRFLHGVLLMSIVLASDNFDRANADPISGSWTTATSEAAFRIVSNVAREPASGVDGGSYYSGIVWPADQFSRGKLTVVGTAGGGAGGGFKVRQSSSANTQYRLVVDHAASNNVDLQKVLAGVYSSVTGYPRTQAWTDGDTWELRVVGTTLSVWLNGTQVGADATDAGIASGNAGIAFSSIETSVSINDWEGGNSTATSPLILRRIFSPQQRMG